MQRPKSQWMALAAMLALALGTTASAVEPPPTMVTVERLCDGCARKICAKLQETPGVAAVKANVAAKTFSITPKTSAVLSPRALWEVVETGGERPVKLEGPSGTFTAKPGN